MDMKIRNFLYRQSVKVLVIARVLRLRIPSAIASEAPCYSIRINILLTERGIIIVNLFYRLFYLMI